MWLHSSRICLKLEWIITAHSSVPLRSTKCGSQWLWLIFFFLAYHILKPFLHIHTEYLSQILVKITYCAAQQNDFLKFNVLGYFIFSSTYQKQLSSNYGIQSASFHSWHICVWVYKFKDLLKDQISSFNFLFARKKQLYILQSKSTTRKSVVGGLYPRHL